MIQPLQIVSSFFEGHERSTLIGQILVVLIVLTMTRAFALTNLFEVCLWFWVGLNRDLRTRFVASFSDSRVALTFIFWAWIAVTALWGDASLGERFEDWWSWRKLMLVPICFVLFQTVKSKYLLASALVAICSIYMIFTWLGHFGLVQLDRAPESLLENHSTQGILFSGSALLISLLGFSRSSRASNFLLFVALLGFLLNVIFISTGRSAYIFLLVVASCAGFASFPKQRLLAGVLIASSVFGGLISSETARFRVTTAVNDAVTAYQSDSEISDAGIRVVMWRNSLQLIGQKPLLGSGSGSYRHDYEQLVSQDHGWRARITDDPHQQYLLIAAEYGLIGLGIFLVTLFAWFASESRVGDRFRIVAVCILLGTLANGFVNGHFSSFVEGRFVWIFMAALLSGSNDGFKRLIQNHINRLRVIRFR